MRKLFIAMTVLGTISASLASASSKIECTYKSTKSEVTIDLHPNLTQVNIDVVNGSQQVSLGLAHRSDFDTVKYVSNSVAQKQISSGIFYSLRRDDSAGIKVRAVVGNITNGSVADVQSVIWDFGSETGMVLTGPQSLQNLTCIRLKK